MNREDIIRMGIEAGLYSGNPRTPGTGNMIVRRLERFATLVAAAEREACAKVCVEHARVAQSLGYKDVHQNQMFWNGEELAATKCAVAIRARSKK